MRPRRRHPAALVALLALLVFLPVPARAFHDEREHVLDYTAHTMPAGDLRVGVWDVGWAPWGWLTLDTYTWPWLKKIANVSAKLRLWRDDDWAVAAKLGYLTLDAHDLSKDAPEARFHVIPLEAAVSRRLGADWELSAAGVYTVVRLDGSYDATDFHGAAAYSNAQLTLALEWRLNERWALFLRSRHLLKLQAGGVVTQPIPVGDPYTTLEIQAEASTDPDIGGMGFPQTFQVVPGFAYSREVFNLEVGLGYGNVHVPGVNVFLPQRWLAPQLDLYWRW